MPHPLRRPLVRALLLSVVALLIAARLYPFVFRIFNWDELGLLSQAWVRVAAGWRSESRPGLVLTLLRPAFALGDGQVPVMYLGRAINLVALLGVFWGTWSVARRLYGRGAAVLALVFLSAHSLFFAHSVELRTETFALAFALAAVALAEARAARGLGIWPALLPAGAALLCSQKAAYTAVWYLAAHLLGAGARWRMRDQRGVLGVAVGGLGAFAVYALVTVPLDQLGPWVWRLSLGALHEVRSPFYQDWVQWTYPKWSFEREPLFYALPLLSLFVGPWRRPRMRAAWVQLGVVAGVLVFHAARFPYFFLTLAPLWAVPAGALLHVALAGLAAKHRPRAARVLLGAAWLGLMVPFALQTPELFRRTVDSQLEVIRRLERLFPAGTPAFDPHHLMIFHAQAVTPLYSRAVNGLRREPGARAALLRTLREKAPVYYLQSKRTTLLPPEIHRFLDRHFVRMGTNLYVAGVKLAAPGRFEILRAGRYRLTADRREPGAERSQPWPADVKVDGVAYPQGQGLSLTAGWHEATWTGQGVVRVRITLPGIDAYDTPWKANVQVWRPYK